MTKVMRKTIENAIVTIWKKRDVGLSEDSRRELRRATDADLAFLYRFWSHQDRHWDEDGPNVPTFQEEPPKGYAVMEAESKKIAVVLGADVLHPYGSATIDTPRKGYQACTPSRNVGGPLAHPVFKSANGGHLTGRQFAGSKKIFSAVS